VLMCQRQRKGRAILTRVGNEGCSAYRGWRSRSAVAGAALNERCRGGSHAAHRLRPPTAYGRPPPTAAHRLRPRRHMSEVLKGRVVELEAQKGALEKEAGLQTKILDLQNTLLAVRRGGGG
jgi:hypothetical protein